MRDFCGRMPDPDRENLLSAVLKAKRAIVSLENMYVYSLEHGMDEMFEGISNVADEIREVADSLDYPYRGTILQHNRKEAKQGRPPWKR